MHSFYSYKLQMYFDEHKIKKEDDRKKQNMIVWEIENDTVGNFPGFVIKMM